MPGTEKSEKCNGQEVVIVVEAGKDVEQALAGWRSVTAADAW